MVVIIKIIPHKQGIMLITTTSQENKRNAQTPLGPLRVNESYLLVEACSSSAIMGQIFCLHILDGFPFDLYQSTIWQEYDP